MVKRRVLESTVFDDGVPVEEKSGIFVNKGALTSLAQHGAPSKIFPLLVLISKNEAIKEFDLPDVLPPLPVEEEVPQSPNLLDVGRWVDSIACLEDALFAAQISQIIFNRLPESYKTKLTEVS